MSKKKEQNVCDKMKFIVHENKHWISETFFAWLSNNFEQNVISFHLHSFVAILNILSKWSIYTKEVRKISIWKTYVNLIAKYFCDQKNWLITILRCSKNAVFIFLYISIFSISFHVKQIQYSLILDPIDIVIPLNLISCMGKYDGHAFFFDGYLQRITWRDNPFQRMRYLGASLIWRWLQRDAQF